MWLEASNRVLHFAQLHFNHINFTLLFPASSSKIQRNIGHVVYIQAKYASLKFQLNFNFPFLSWY